MIYCLRCKREHDRDLPKCPYCGNLSPVSQQFKRMLIAALIVLAIALLACIGSYIYSWTHIPKPAFPPNEQKTSLLHQQSLPPITITGKYRAEHSYAYN